MLGIKVSDFFYYSRRFRKRKKKKIRNGEQGLRYSRTIFLDGRNATERGVRLRKARKKKKPGIESLRICPRKILFILDPGKRFPSMKQLKPTDG